MNQVKRKKEGEGEREKPCGCVIDRMEMDDCQVDDDSFIERRRLFNHADMIINTCLYQ